MAHVERRADRKYRARYRGPDGRERSRTFDTKRAAERWLANVETKKGAGEWVDPAAGKVRFDDYAAAWLATKVDAAPRTLVNIEGRIRKHANPYFGPMAMADVRSLHVRSWVANMHAVGLARATIKAAYLTVAQVFASSVVDGVIGRTPCVGIDFGTERAREEALFLTARQVADLADAITPRYRAAVLVAGYEGLRAGELWALKARSVNELTRTIDVTGSAYEVRGVRAEGPTKTGSAYLSGLG
jgi:integrase